MATYFIMKVRGKAKIPDYIQLRDENLTLIGYFRPGRNERLDKVIPDEAHAEHLRTYFDTIPYGKITRVDI